MKLKTISKKVSYSLASFLFAMSSGQAATADIQTGKQETFVRLASKDVKVISSDSLPNHQSKLQIYNKDEPRSLYIVTFKQPSAAMYDGSLRGLQATNPHEKLMRSGNQFIDEPKKQKMTMDDPSVKAYVNHLKSKQDSMMSVIEKMAPSSKLIKKLQLSLNAVILELSADEAKKISALPDVLSVEQNQRLTLDIDVGPALVGAPEVWDGSANAGVANQGEGVIIGIIDSGINTDHPSFAAVAGDGYVHTNPLGSGVFKGDCAQTAPELCNDKLIGLYSYSTITDIYDDLEVFPPNLPRVGEDYSGHGSHVGSTAGGNVLFDVPVLRPESTTEGDGIETGLALNRLSGVAPRANIIGYQVCQPGASGDRYSVCDSTVSVMAIEDAILDGVDILNYSISSPNRSPWVLAVERAFLAARNAGIFVATSAGNSGLSGTNKSAPWYTAVAASEHGRVFVSNKDIGDFTGGETDLELLSGQGAGEGVSGEIVFAGQVDGLNDTDEGFAKCLEPFEQNSVANKIVVCERGGGARVAKAVNVAAGGAIGMVLINVESEGSGATLVADNFVIPGVHLDQTAGEALVAWLASGDNHRASIFTAITEALEDPERVDAIGDFSSRGPNLQISTLAPTLTAPGVGIYAAYADQHFGRNVNQPAPADFRVLQGTSMASPHVAGSAALIRGTHPSWTPDNIRSALSMTTEQTVTLEDGETPANFFVMGSGRIRVDRAIQAGLVLDESDQNYEAANPRLGGDPRSLNIPSVTDNDCVRTCTWTRTFTATKSGTWSARGISFDGIKEISVFPEEFSLAQGEKQDISINITYTSFENNDFSFGEVVLESTSSPTLKLPVITRLGEVTFPSSLSFVTQRDQDAAVVDNVRLGSNLEIQTTVHSRRAFDVVLTASRDSEPSSAFDNLEDGVTLAEFFVPADELRLVANTTGSTSESYRTMLVRDDNGNGLPDEFEIIQEAGTDLGSTALDVMFPDEGRYWLVIHNTDEGEQTDEFFIDFVTISTADDAEFEFVTPSQQTNGSADYSIKWQLDPVEPATTYFGVLVVDTFNESGDTVNLTTIPLDLIRLEDDISLVSNQTERVEHGGVASYSFHIQPNLSPEDRTYEIVLPLPSGVRIDRGALDERAQFNSQTNTVTWTVEQPSLISNPPTYRFTNNETDGQCKTPERTGFDGGYIALSELGVEPLSRDVDDNFVGFTFVPVPFLNEFPTPDNKLGALSISENGYLSFDQPAILSVFNFTGISNIPRKMPDTRFFDGIVAPFWRDLVFDEDLGSDLYFINVPDFEVSVVEWDNMRFASEKIGVEKSNDRLDILAVINHAPEDGEPDFVFAYREVEHELGNAAPVAIGYEDINGESGTTLLFSDGEEQIGDVTTDVYDGLMTCMYLEQSSQLQTIEFSLTPSRFTFTESSIDLQPYSIVLNNENTAQQAIEANRVVEVDAAPVVRINDRSIFLDTVRDDTFTLNAEINDPNGDDFTYRWVQIAGPEITIPEDAGLELTLSTPELSGPTIIRLRLEATDERGLKGDAQAWLLFSGK